MIAPSESRFHFISHPDEMGADEDVFGLVFSDLALQLMFTVLVCGVSLVPDLGHGLRRLEMELAKVDGANELPKTPDAVMPVFIQAEGSIQVDGERVTRPELEDRVRRFVNESKAKKYCVQIVPDGRVSTCTLVSAVEAIAQVTDQYETIVQQ